MSVQGLGDISYEIGRLMEMLQQFQASQPGAGQFGKQRGGGCFGNDERSNGSLRRSSGLWRSSRRSGSTSRRMASATMASTSTSAADLAKGMRGGDPLRMPPTNPITSCQRDAALGRTQ